MSPAPQRLLLASSSPRRLDLVRQIGLEPDAVEAAELDEAPLIDETPRRLALRLAVTKADRLAAMRPQVYVLAADTVVAVGRRILPKAIDEAQTRQCLALLSGRCHRVLTGVAVVAPGGRRANRLVETRVNFKRLSHDEIETYVRCGEGLGKAGVYAIQGRAGAFVTGLRGSYSAVVGLPLYETSSLLIGLGYRGP